MIEDSERLKVLKMVEAGKISANEAVQLLESLEKAGTKPLNLLQKIQLGMLGSTCS